MRAAVAAATVTAATAVVLTGLAGCSETDGPGATGAPVATRVPVPSGAPGADADAERAFRALERQYGAQIGVVAVDTGDGHALGYRGDQRFAYASTNKTFIAAAVLDATTTAGLDEVVHYDRSDLLEYAPVTSTAVDTGLTVRQLLDAALRYSDNTAANLLVERLGGVDGVTRFLRGIGDDVTDVSRVEPELNTALPGDRRDTTTPAQFAADLRAVLLGDALDADDRALLRDLMLRNTTGDATIRAGVDQSWSVADKTGTGAFGVRNDIAVVTPPGEDPIVLVVMTARDPADAEPSDALVADAAATAVARLG